MESTSEKASAGLATGVIRLVAGALLALVGAGAWWGLGSRGLGAKGGAALEVGSNPGRRVGVELAPGASHPSAAELSKREALAAGGSAGGVERAPEPAAEPPAEVSARFLDPNGAPLAGVELWSLGAPEVVARSAGDGVVRLALDSGSRSSESVTLAARCAGFAREQRSARLEPGGPLRLGDWVLVPGGGVTGRVVDEDGRGLAEVQVACRKEGLEESQWDGVRRLSLDGLARPGSRALSESDGSFVLADVPAGSVRLVAVAEDRPASVSEPVRVPAGGWASDATIRMEPADGGSLLAGVVLAPDGRALPHAGVRIEGGGTSYSLACDDGGRFELRSTHTEPCDITAADPAGRYREALRRAVRPGTTDLVLRLGEAPALELRVRSREGEPIEHYAVATIAAQGAEVRAFLLESERPGGSLLLGCPSGSFLVEVRARDWKPARLGPFTAGTVPPVLEFRLDAAAGVQGRVTARGAPVPAARVGLYELNSTNDTHNGFPLRTGTRPEQKDVCDADGRFSLSVEHAGTYCLRAEAPGYALAELGPLQFSPDERCEESLELGPGGTLEARVRSASGASVVGKLVAISRGDGLARTRRTDEEGHVRFETLTPGPWQVVLSENEIDPRQGSTYSGTAPAGEIPANCRVSEGEVTRVDLWLERADEGVCQLSGRLVIDGEPAEGWFASLDSEDGLAGKAPVRVELGAFRLTTDAPGARRLSLRCESPEPGAMLLIRESVELSEGERFWSLELETGLVEGSLASGPGLVFHRWRRGPLECFAPLLPDADGRFRARVPAGPGELVRLDPELPLESQTPMVLRAFTLVSGETLEL